jgi:hypothetical protein
MHQMTDQQRDPVERLLEASDPIGDADTGPGVEEALDQLGSGIMSRERAGQAKPAHRRPLGGPRGLVAVGIALLVLGGGVAAATQLFGGRTLHYADPDFCRKVLRLSADIPYPPGYSSWRSWVLVAQLQVPRVTTKGACDSQTQGGRAITGPNDVRASFARSAFCAWVYDWRDARRAGDQAAAHRAAGVISNAPGWSAVRAEDPHPTASAVHETDYGRHNPHNRFVVDRHSLFGWFLPFGQAVRRGNIGRVDWLIAGDYGGCPSVFQPLSGSHGGTVLPRRFRSAIARDRTTSARGSRP